MFPPTLLLVQLFRRTKRRNTRISKIKRVLNDNNLNSNLITEENETEAKKDSKIKNNFKISELKLPWWFKIFSYLISFLFAGVSLFFVIVKGIEFGDEKVQNWITSLFISFLTSLLLTQPVQVAIRSIKKY